MKEQLAVIVCLLAFLGLANGITVGPVRLASQETYISYHLGASETNSLIECPVNLKGEEELKEVSWVFQNDDSTVGRYFWTPDSGGKGEGLLKNAVRLDREDGNLELTELRYDLAGLYSCSATTIDDQSDEASEWEVLIVDLTSNTPFQSVDGDHCQITSSFRMSALFPEPTMHSGFYSESLGGFYEEVTALEWHKQEFDNKSFAYSHEDIVFEITADTPRDANYINSVGITKKDGTYIALLSVKTIIHEFEEKGCPPLQAKAYQHIEYSNGGKTTCRGEILPPGAGQLRATVSCLKGYKAEDPEGRQSMELGCSTKSWKWGVPNDYPSLSHIKCVVADSAAFTASGSTALVLVCLLVLRFMQQ